MTDMKMLAATLCCLTALAIAEPALAQEIESLEKQEGDHPAVNPPWPVASAHLELVLVSYYRRFIPKAWIKNSRSRPASSTADYPLMFPMGVSFTTGLLRPAWLVAATTSSMFL